MTLSEDDRQRLSQWCATRVPAGDRARRQIGYTVQGDEITISERRAPLYPELDSAWSSLPLVRLHHESPHSNRWLIYEWESAGRRWMPSGDHGSDPVTLLDRYAADPAA
jgi:hypothetical protein